LFECVVGVCHVLTTAATTRRTSRPRGNSLSTAVNGSNAVMFRLSRFTLLCSFAVEFQTPICSRQHNFVKFIALFLYPVYVHYHINGTGTVNGRCIVIYIVSQKTCHSSRLVLGITLANVRRFSKFFRRWTGNKLLLKKNSGV